MSGLSVLWQLAGKELRQLLPLALSLVGLAVLLMVVVSIAPPRTDTQEIIDPRVALAAAPLLFGVAAGAMSIGGEKDAGSMRWLSWLPVRPVEIVGVKWSVAAAVLAGMWGVVFVVASGPRIWLDYPIGGLFWTSWLMLSAGMMTAWLMQHSFGSLIAAVPIAAIPTGVSVAAGEFLDGYRLPQAQADLVAVWQIAMAVGLVPLAIAGGVAELLGWSIGQWRGSKLEDETEASRPVAGGFWPSPPVDAAASITSLWWRHGRWLMATLGVMGLVGSVVWLGLFAVDASELEGGWMTLPGLLILTISWAGVASVHGDGSPGRLRFLTDRGVSPGMIWVSRHGPMLALIAGTSMLLFGGQVVLRWDLASSGYVSDAARLARPAFSLVGYLAIGVIVYGTSVYFGMLLRPIAAAAVVSPILSAVAVGAVAGAGLMFGIPFSLLAVASVLPLAASALMMRDFAESNFRGRYWGLAGGAAALWAGIVLGPAAMPLFRGSDVDPVQIAVWDRVSETPVGPRAGYGTLTPIGDGVQTDLTVQQWVERLEAVNVGPDELLGQYFGGVRHGRGQTLALSDGSTSELLSKLTLLRLGVGGAGDAVAISELESWLAAAATLVSAGRQSGSLESQAEADRIEMVMTRVIGWLQRQRWVDRSFAVAAREQIADSAGRQAARRRAVLSSRLRWMREIEKEDGEDSLVFGGIEVNGSVYGTVWEWTLASKSIISELTDVLVSLTGDGLDAAEIGRLRRRMHELTVPPWVEFEDGPYGAMFRMDDIDQPFALERHGFDFVAQWRAGWEEVAAGLGPRKPGPRKLELGKLEPGKLSSGKFGGGDNDEVQ